MSRIKVRRRRGREGNNNFFSSNTFFFIVLIQLAVSVSILVTLVWKIHSFDVRGASSATSTTAAALQQDITARVEDQATSSLSLHIEPAIINTPKASEEQNTNISELKEGNIKQQKYPQYKHTNKRAAYTKKRRMEVLTEKDIKLAPLPDHCLGQHKKGEIVLKGERHSGTNLIENILSKNTWIGVNPILNERTSTFGWKHGM